MLAAALGVAATVLVIELLLLVEVEAHLLLLLWDIEVLLLMLLRGAGQETPTSSMEKVRRKLVMVTCQGMILGSCTSRDQRMMIKWGLA